MSVRRFDVEPPDPAGSGRLTEWDEVEYASAAPPAGGFILPPPRRSRDAVREVTRRVGEELARVREVADVTAVDLSNMGVVVANYGDQLETKVEPWAVPTVAPLSSTINRRADPSFQLSDFSVPQFRAEYSDRDDVSTKTRYIEPGDVTWSLPTGGMTKGRIYFTFITPAINRVYERLNFMAAAVSSPCRMDVGIYVVDEATSQLVRQVDVPDAGAGIGTGESVVSVTFEPWVATQGSYIAVVWVQSGTGNARGVYGLNEVPRPLPTAYFPRKISAMSGATTYTGLPATFDGTDATVVDFSLLFTPYVELSENIGIELKAYHDAFTSSSNRYATRPWVGLTDAKVRIQSAGWAGVPTTLVISYGTRAALYESPLSTDRVEVVARALVDSAVGPGAWSFLAVRTTNNMRVGVGVFYSVDTVQIRSWSVGSAEDIHTGSVVRASSSWVIGESATFSAVWDAGELVVYDDLGVAVLSWVDTVTVAEPRYRFVGIGFERISGASSPRLDDWVARDLADDEDEEA